MIERRNMMKITTIIRKGFFDIFYKACAFALGIFSFISFAAWTHNALAASQASPTIRLFPTTIVENIKHTGETAKAMEESLQNVIRDLEQQMAIYRASKCEGSESDEGCSEIVKQMGEKYMEMLNRMESQLPEMERSIKVTSASLERRLRQELGRKMTPRDLQKMLSGDRKPVRRLRQGASTGRLSQKFRKYYELVALGSRTGAGGSLAAVASDIYLDTMEVKKLIALTRDEIGRAKLMIDLQQTYGSITPEMSTMIVGVKEIIFGEAEGVSGVAPPPPGSTKKEYRSPLEM